jgi:ABC-2 type transport system permease protein
MTTATPAPLLLSLSVISAFAGGVIQLALYVGGGLFLFRPPLHVNIAGCLAVFTLSLAIAVSVGMIAAGLQIAIHKGSAALWLLGSTAWVVSGTLFPVGALPRPIEIVAQLLPMTHSLAGMRLAVVSDGSPALIKEIGVLVVFSMVLVPASIGFFSWTLRRARQFGTLSFY